MNDSAGSHLLPIKGAYNMRDLGGYKTKDNKYIKSGIIIRSGDMAQLTEEDLKYLSTLPLRTIIDFRDKFEKDAAPDKQPESLQTATWLPIGAGDLSNIQPENPEDIPQIMENVYKTIIRNFQNELKDFFRIVEDETKAPLLFHCSAGKDRTGIAAALLLSALGVDKNTILEDYMLSAEYIKGKYDYIVKLYPSLAPLTTVQLRYLEAALQTIDEEFGGMESYLKNTLEVNTDKLKSLYTE